MADDIFKSAAWARGAAFVKPAETEAQAIIRNARALIANRER